MDEGSVRNVDVVVHYVVQGVVDECSLITCPSNLQCHIVKGMLNASVHFYRQLDFSYEPANEILENEPKSCLTVA